MAKAPAPTPGPNSVTAPNAPPVRQPAVSAANPPRSPAQTIAPSTSPAVRANADVGAPERRPATLPSPRMERASQPGISGPSFLGLNTPAPDRNTGARFDQPGNSSDGRDHLQSSGSVDYLLDDEEEPKGGGGGKMILFIVALALAVGFGYLHWKRGGFEWLTGDKKAAVTDSAPDSTPPAPDAGTTPANSGAPSPSTPPTASAPIPTDSAPAAPADSTANSPATSQAPPQSTSAQPAPPPSSSTPPTAAASGDDSGAASNSPSHPADSASDSSQSDSGQPSTVEEAPPAVEKPVAKPAPRKPASARSALPKPSAALPFDSVAEAERYIYGRGVSQDCDHGLRLLKPAAQQSNPRAMISLGALYSTGTCTPRDLPTAYRWFAQALHKQPDNQVLQNDLQKLWSQMTQPERQLAIKLSQ